MLWSLILDLSCVLHASLKSYSFQVLSDVKIVSVLHNLVILSFKLISKVARLWKKEVVRSQREIYLFDVSIHVTVTIKLSMDVETVIRMAEGSRLPLLTRYPYD